MRALPVARPLRSLTGPDVRQQVILRSHPGEDFPECDAMWTQPQVVKSVRRRPAETDGVTLRTDLVRSGWRLIGGFLYPVHNLNAVHSRVIRQYGHARIAQSFEDSNLSLTNLQYADIRRPYFVRQARRELLR